MSRGPGARQRQILEALQSGPMSLYGLTAFVFGVKSVRSDQVGMVARALKGLLVRALVVEHLDLYMLNDQDPVEKTDWSTLGRLRQLRVEVARRGPLYASDGRPLEEGPAFVELRAAEHAYLEAQRALRRHVASAEQALDRVTR